VTIAGNPAPTGTLIEALNPRGQVVGCFVVQAAGYYGFMPVYGEDTTATPPIPGMRDGETVRFRVGGQEAIASPLLIWHNDQNVHEVALAVGAGQQQAISLHQGWNLISFRLQPASTAIRDVLQSINGQYDMVLGETGTFVPSLPDEFQSLRELHPGKAYWIRVTPAQGATLLIAGTPLDPSTPISLSRGWRWVGYLPQATLPITVALQSIGGQYDMVRGEGGAYVPGLPDVHQTLREMRSGAGYLIRMTADGTLVYPAGAQGSQGAEEWRSGGAREHLCAHVRISPFLTLAYGRVTINGAPAPVGTVVEAVTPRGDIAGCFVVVEAGHYGLIELYGEDLDAVTPGWRVGEPIRWRVNGIEATSSVALTWDDDGEVHQLDLSVNHSLQPVFLPLILRQE
jgi:hypothetical protein